MSLSTVPSGWDIFAVSEAASRKADSIGCVARLHSCDLSSIWYICFQGSYSRRTFSIKAYYNTGELPCLSFVNKFYRSLWKWKVHWTRCLNLHAFFSELFHDDVCFPTMQLFTVRELSIMSNRKSPVAMHFVPNVGPWSDGTTSSWGSPRVGTNIHHSSELPGEAAKQPTR